MGKNSGGNSTETAYAGPDVESHYLTVLVEGPLYGSILVLISLIQQLVLMDVGGYVFAGIWEEAFFRVLVYGCTIECFEIKNRWIKVFWAILVSLWFSHAHGQQDWYTFIFRFEAGLYFNMLYCLRGYLTVAWTHSFYNLLVLFVGLL